MPSTKKAKIKSYKFGIVAEYIVILYLTFKFYKIIHSRYRSKAGEIDIIAQKGRLIIFIEVKARKNKRGIFEVLSKSQQQRIIRSSELFMAQNRKFTGYDMRFDLIVITPGLFIKHIKNAWWG